MILPQYVTLQNFANSLIIDFPKDNIVILRDDKDWKHFASFLTQSDSFANNGAPGPGLYEDPNQWAMALFKSMASFA